MNRVLLVGLALLLPGVVGAQTTPLSSLLDRLPTNQVTELDGQIYVRVVDQRRGATQGLERLLINRATVMAGHWLCNFSPKTQSTVGGESARRQPHPFARVRGQPGRGDSTQEAKTRLRGADGGRSVTRRVVPADCQFASCSACGKPLCASTSGCGCIALFLTRCINPCCPCECAVCGRAEWRAR